MLTKTILAFALVLTTASGALAAQKKYSNANQNTQAVYDIRGWQVGADPDPTVRAQIAHDPIQ